MSSGEMNNPGFPAGPMLAGTTSLRKQAREVSVDGSRGSALKHAPCVVVVEMRYSFIMLSGLRE